MKCTQRQQADRLSINLPVSVLLLAASVFLFPQLTAPRAAAQTFTVLHNFSGGADGASPEAGLILDRAGNLYGTTSAGGYMGEGCSQFGGCGIVFRLALSRTGWVLGPLHAFGSDGPDGFAPLARVIFGPDGSLYGTTSMGGHADGGIVFNLRPSPGACRSALCPWSETLVHRFTTGADEGANPGFGDLIFDTLGNIYGTTAAGGLGLGTVFELSPSGGSWAENTLYSFNAPPDGTRPYSGVIFDQAGNLYGTTSQGGGSTNCGYAGCGTVYQLTPSASGWTESILYGFQDGSDGELPYGGVIFGSAGDLCGTSDSAAFELTPSGGNWGFTALHSFAGIGASYGALVKDAAGNLYGTTLYSVFELTPSDGGWNFTLLHSFTGGSDGGQVFGSVLLDADGNLYGTASSGGAYRYGTVWKIAR